MKKKILFFAINIFGILILNSCADQLTLSPISSISDGNFWQNPEQVDTFVSGIHARFRGHNANFQNLGEVRADIFGTDPGSSSAFSGESTAGLEYMWNNNLSADNPGVSAYGGFYANINQLNLLISKLNTLDIVTPANKSYYLGIAYGMRAFYYYQLTMAWGKVIIQTEPTVAIDIANLAKSASSEEEVMKLIKSDIELSLTNFGSNYTFRNTKSYWSKAATLMLKADVHLWTAQRSGGAADATIAKNALTDIQTNVAGLSLQATYANIFSSTNRGNSEIIFASRNLLNEASINIVAYLPQTGLIANYYDSLANRKFDVVTDNWGGSLRAPTKIATFRSFNDKDSRKIATIQPAYTRTTTGTTNTYKIAGCFMKKYAGEQNAGARVLSNDYPIYRYADLLLLLAEAKVILGESPATEINLVRARAYGTNYTLASFGFPNQTIDKNPKDAVLKERYFEFMLEGKRWLDLRRFGDAYVFANTNIKSTEAYKVLWPVDRATLTNNRSLTQSPGYPQF